MRRLGVATVHEKILVAIERCDALFERCDLRVEVLDHLATVVLLRVEKDASQGRIYEVAVFLWDGGLVGHHWGSGSESVSIQARAMMCTVCSIAHGGAGRDGMRGVN